MKKIYFSLMTIAALLFTACNSDEGPGNVENTGAELVTTITFDDGLRANPTVSTAIPITTWANVKQLQLFLYDCSGTSTDGTVAYSAMIESGDIPTGSGTKEFIWSGVPTGTYRLALVANARSTSDKVDTYVDGNKTVFTSHNVKNHKFQASFTTPVSGTGLQIDLKQEGSLVNAGNWSLGLTNYAIPSEIFTAYSENVVIAKGATTTISGALILQREVSMMRARFDIGNLDDLQQAMQPSVSPTPKALFDNGTNNFIAVRRLPVGFGLKVDGFAGGVFDTSDNSRVMMVSSGAGTFKNANPSTGYSAGIILDPLDTKFTLWHDIMVLPNISEAQKGVAEFPGMPANNAYNDRKYFIVVCARAEAGYMYDNILLNPAADGDPIYWTGTIDGRFLKNTIQELNITFLSAGSPNIPDPKDEGSLDIEIGAPQNWVLATESYEKEL